MICDGGINDFESSILAALFRYGVIAPLVEPDELAYGEVARIVAEVASQTHFFPGKGPIQIKERTVYDWLSRYRKAGMDGLRRKTRKDKGLPRVLSEEVLARAIQLRKEAPKRWTSTLLDILRLEGLLASHSLPHRSTLDRHLAKRGASRRHMRVLGEKCTIKMVFENFGDIWVGDYHHGPLVLGPDGKPTTAKLGAFIDHCTRYPVANRYYLAENVGSLRDCLMRAFLTWGKPKKTYVDRGSVFRARQLKFSLDRIHSILIHSRAYYSQGRGVIERWWQVVGQFEDEVALRDDLLTIHELNRLWEAYRELRYCQTLHSAIRKTPNEAVAEVNPIPLDPDVAKELFLVREPRTVNKKDCCVSVLGKRFLCESFLKGQRIQVHFDPNDLRSVLIFHDDKKIQKAFPQVPNAAPQPHPEPENVQQSVDYLALVRDEYDRKLLSHVRPLAYCDLNADPKFDIQSFLAVICELAGLKPTASEEKELRAFWNALGPIPEPLVRIATEHAMRLHGRRRHVRTYLHAIRTLVLADLHNPKKEENP